MSSPARPPVPGGVPAPPGGHPLRIDPRHAPHRTGSAAVPAQGSASRPTTHATSLPVVDETSAGGIVVTRHDGVYEAAVIGRRNRAGRLEWCLPKGHLEGDETPEQAAVREIAEETGISGRVLRELGVIDYWFSGGDRRVHKVVHHYLLDAVGGTLTVEGDPDGEAEVAAWVPVAELHDRLAYPNERRLAQTAAVALADEA